MVATAMTQRTLGRLRLLLLIIVASALIGGAYGFGADGNWAGFARGFTMGTVISLLIGGLEIGLDEPIRRQVARYPLAVLLAARTIIYGLCIVLGSTVGALIVPLPTAPSPWFPLSGRDYVFSFAMALFLNTVLAISRLLGPGMLTRFLSGRYHRPRPEDRIFLILDLRGSTAIAARIGNASFLRLLDQYFVDLAHAMINNGGEVYRYVGDAMIVTWAAERGLRRGCCLQAALAARALLAARGPHYLKEFGLVPEMRMALHGGPVVSGEIGAIKREIVYLGDGINLAAKLESHGKTHGAELILSTDLLARLGPLPDGIAARPLPPLVLPEGRRLDAVSITMPAASPRRP